MSYQAYLDAVRKKTGKSMEDFHELAKRRGFLDPDTKAGEVVAWLKSEFGLGYGHAMAVYGVIRSSVEPKLKTGERIDAHFSGRRASWKSSYERIVKAASGFGRDVSVKPGDSYLSLLRNGKKFAILKVGTGYLDIGLKLKSAAAAERLEPSGTWNAMVTHRVRIQSPDELDREVLTWLRSAYAAAK
ncbi:MAG TPA: DUF4287 domain-containing protein [Candidatus Elarobacter sp.]|jgi:hypothetical protein|nr:DUF4287 domain-containing protein [Candidatus Elarobacter sp.]